MATAEKQVKNEVKDTESIFLGRRRTLLRTLGEDAGLVLGNPSGGRHSERTSRPNANMQYLAGLGESDTALLLLGKNRGPRTILYLRERDAERERWEGERLGLRRAQRRCSIDEVRNIDELETDLVTLLRGYHTLHYTPGVHPDIDALVWRLFEGEQTPRGNTLRQLRDLREELGVMRSVKSREEIRMLRHAIEITARGFSVFARHIPNIANESHGARLLEEEFARLGSDGLGFPTIVAAGRHATCLHHPPTQHPLWKRELVLVDAGAAFRGYGADISRTFPVSGTFNAVQGELYDVVHGALQAAIRKAGPGITLESIHQSALKALADGLVYVGVFRGTTANVVHRGLIKNVFMHRIGHFFGLDVHEYVPGVKGEVGRATSSWTRPLEPGNTITIEPGLYIDSNEATVLKRFRGIGIRIEDDVLITADGCEVLSRKLPTKRSEVEALMES